MENQENSQSQITVNPDSLTLLSDDEILQYTQRRRRLITNQLMKNGFPEDKDDRHALLHVLDGMDKAALGNKRVRSADKLADETAGIRRGIVEMVSTFGNDNPFLKGGGGSVLERISDATALPEARIIEGEFNVGSENQDFEQFIEDNGFGPVEQEVDESGKFVSSTKKASETTGVIIEDEDKYFSTE